MHVCMHVVVVDFFPCGQSTWGLSIINSVPCSPARGLAHHFAHPADLHPKWTQSRSSEADAQQAYEYKISAGRNGWKIQVAAVSQKRHNGWTWGVPGMLFPLIFLLSFLPPQNEKIRNFLELSFTGLFYAPIKRGLRERAWLERNLCTRSRGLHTLGGGEQCLNCSTLECL